MCMIHKISPIRFLMDRKINQFSKTVNGGRILEIGAGPKSYRSLFPNCSVISTDILEHPNIDEIADVTNLQFDNASFDYVLCFNVLEHVFDINKAVQEINRVLKKGGTCVIITAFLYPIHDPPNDFYRITRFAYEKMLSNFSKVQIDEIPILPFGIFKRFVLFNVIVVEK